MTPYSQMRLSMPFDAASQEFRFGEGDPGEADEGGEGGKSPGEVEGGVGAVVGEKGEHEGNQGSPGGLPREAGHSQHTTGSPATGRRGGGNQDTVVRGLEEAEPGTTQGHETTDHHVGSRVGEYRHEEEPHGKQPETDTPEYPGMHALDELTGQRCGHHGRQGPGGKQHPGLDLRHPERVLQEEGERHEGEHLRHEGADGGTHGKGKYRDFQQINRQKRERTSELLTDEEVTDNEGEQDAGGEYLPTDLVGESLDGEDEKTEGEGVHQGSRPIETVFLYLHGIGRQVASREHEGEDAYRYIDSKEPLPGSHGQDGGGDGRSAGGGHGHNEGVNTQAPTEMTTGIDEADEGGVDTSQGRRPESLEYPRQGEREEGAREKAGRGGPGKQHQAAEIDFLVPPDVSQRGEGEQGDDNGQLVSVDNPDGGGWRRVEVRRDGGQGHVGNGSVEDGEGYPGGNGQDGPIAPRGGNPVRDGGFRCCMYHSFHVAKVQN